MITRDHSKNGTNLAIPTKTAKTCFDKYDDDTGLKPRTNHLISMFPAMGTKYDEHFGHKSGHKPDKTGQDRTKSGKKRTRRISPGFSRYSRYSDYLDYLDYSASSGGSGGLSSCCSRICSSIFFTLAGKGTPARARFSRMLNPSLAM